MSAENQFGPFAERMRAEGLPETFIETFHHYYEKLVQGETGMIPEAGIEPVDALPDSETLPARLAEVGEAALAKTAVIKLNGGLGTSMGLEKAKSLLRVKDDLTFLDIIARQAIRAGVPLVLMNSFNTAADSLALLAEYEELQESLELSFLQHKEPKVRQDNCRPVEWPEDPSLEWCPPGHGDIYTALVTRGALAKLLDAGYEYAFVSNADNLGAVVDRAILGYFAENEFPFLMEVADRTEMDKKGGHLARQNGRFILRESAQCPAEDMDAFKDIRRHKYFNTNNLWLNLRALQRVMAERDNQLGLPLIRNAKTVDPRDPESTPVYQLETAMGSAIGVFEGAQAIRVPRSRFAPVKKTDDLLAVRSDAYALTEDYRVVVNPARGLDALVVALDRDHYRLVDELEARFPYGPPSLLHCARLEIEGDFRFGRGVICRGAIHLVNENAQQVIVPDAAVLGEARS